MPADTPMVLDHRVAVVMGALDDFHVLAGRVTQTQAAHVLAKLDALSASPVGEGEAPFTADDLAQEIRRVDGNNSLGAGALAEALMPFLSRPTPATPEGLRLPWLQMVYELRHPERERVGWQDNADLMRAAADEIERLAALQPQGDD